MSRLLGGALNLICKTTRWALDSTSDILFYVLVSGKKHPLPPIKNALLLETASSLASQIRMKQIKSVDVVQAYVDRIKEVNDLLNAVVDDRFDEALGEAKAADELVANSGRSAEQLEHEYPLLGVPITVKECFGVAGLRRTVGVVSLRDQEAEHDSDAVKQLKQAGAIIIAVTNVPELCLAWETNNKIYGRTKNPYNTALISGGSSGGEGAIISAAGSVVGIGSDIAGSIRLPGMFNGIFGFKPSSHTVSLAGMLPDVSEDLKNYFVGGPMCRYASDILPVFKSLVTEEVAGRLQLNNKVDLHKHNLKVYYFHEHLGVRLTSPISPQIKRAIHKAVRHLEAGFNIKAARADIPKLQDAVSMFLFTFFNESKQGFSLLMGEGEPSQLNQEMMNYMMGRSPHTLTTIFAVLVERVSSSYPEYYEPMNKLRNEIRDELNAMLGDNGVLLIPTHPTTAVYHGQPLLQMFNIVYAYIFNLFGMPSTHCPLGLSVQGLPVGCQVVAATDNDRLSIAVAEELEKGPAGWVAPCPISLS